jgi:hypothetical protein
MSVPRRQLMWLWAAVWLRWRLMRITARRLFGGRPTAVGGPDYYLAPAEIPVEGVDYDPAELPAGLLAKLEETRAELLDLRRRSTGPGTSRRARRRRLAALATAAVLGAGAVGAGAAALVTGSTGVPAVDRLLGIYEAEMGEPGSPGRSGDGAPDLQPRSSGESTSVEASLGSRRLVNTSYVARGDRICSAVTDRDADPGPSYLACLTPSLLATRLARDDGIVLAVLGERDAAVVRGFVAGRVTTLEGNGPNGPLDIHLGEKWKPGLPGVGVLKPFLALGDTKAPGDAKGPNESDPLRLANPGGYTFKGVTEDGERVRIGPLTRP